MSGTGPTRQEHPAEDRPPDALQRDAVAREVDLPSLQALPAAVLRDALAAVGIEPPPAESQDELVSRLLQHRLQPTTEDGVEIRPTGFTEGLLEVLPDGFGFLRSSISGYQSRADDVYVGPRQVRGLNLRTGHVVKGRIRAPKDGERFLSLCQVCEVDRQGIDALFRQLPYRELTPIYPRERLLLCGPTAEAWQHQCELLAPWGRGQRVLVRLTADIDSTAACDSLVTGLLAANEGVHVVLCRPDARPEDAVPRADSSRQESFLPTFDMPPSNQLNLLSLALARAHRQVEAGRDVVLVLDGLLAAVELQQQTVVPSGRWLAPGLDVDALQLTRRWFAAARCTAEAGSLTVVFLHQEGTSHPHEAAVLQQLLGKGNSDLRLQGSGDGRMQGWIVDAKATRTRNEDLLLSPPRVAALRRLRLTLGRLSETDASRLLARLVATHKSAATVLDADIGSHAASPTDDAQQP
jgi:transcription termination factor Rho